MSEQAFTSLCAAHGVSPRIGYVGSVIVMDAPPETQKNREFAEINRLLDHAKVLVPAIIVSDIEKGFMVLEDMGDFVYINSIPDGKEPAYYFKTLRELTKIGAMPFSPEQAQALEQRRQAALKDPSVEADVIPHYDLDETDYKTLNELPLFDDDFIKMELNICREWLFDKALNLQLSTEDEKMIAQTWDFISEQCRAQPQTAMHRDYHSRNIMVVPAGKEISILSRFAILDYQDMVKGPACYDLASIGYDCYVDMEDEFVEWICKFAYEVYTVCGIFDREQVSLEQFNLMIRLCAIQRHIKVLGLFYRLKLRDGKDGYLQYLPRVLGYLTRNCQYFEQLRPFAAFLEKNVAGRI